MAHKNTKGKGGQGYSNKYGKKDKPTKHPVIGTAEKQPTPAVQSPAAQEPTAVNGGGAQTLQQERAKYALERVKATLSSGVNGKEFKSYAASFPAMVQMNGLGQAAAFYFSQGDTHRRLYDILSGWLTKEKQPYEGQDLLAGITGLDMHRYRIAQAEALLLLDWVKRFAKAFVRED